MAQVGDEGDQSGADFEDNLKAFWELAAGECRWPVRDDSAGKPLFCGRPAVLKSGQVYPAETESYCAFHLRLSSSTIPSPFNWRRVAAGT